MAKGFTVKANAPKTKKVETGHQIWKEIPYVKNPILEIYADLDEFINGAI